MTKVLSQRTVETAKPKAKRYGKPDGIVPGMQLIVQPSGAKSYALFARINGKQINIRLGPAGVLSLAQARDAARVKLGQIAAGKDPRVAKREAQPTSETFAAVAERFIERHAKVHTRSWRETERLLQRDVLPRWRSRPIDSITKHDVNALLDAVVDRAPIAANRTLATGRRVFNWARERGLIETSPFDRIKRPAPETARDRTLDDYELSRIWQAAGALGYPYAPMVRLLILTGQRRCEVSDARWSEFDPGLTLWTLPRERVKNGVEHRLPVSSVARDILLELPRMAGADFIFTTNGKAPPDSFGRAKRRLDATVTALNGGTPIKAWVLHDLRRSFASGAARLGISLPVIEKILNHVGGPSFGGVAGIYQKHTFHDEMTKALELWNQHVLGFAQSGNLQPALLHAGAGR
jgi:integrase